MINVNFILLDLVNNSYTTGQKTAREFVNEFKTELACDLYDVALDQSTSCTGVTIKSVDETFILVLEVVNCGTQSLFMINSLKRILEMLLTGKELRYVIIEEPLPFIVGRHNAKLTSLKNDLIKFFKSDCFSINNQPLIKPQSWRAGLIKKDNPHAKNSKEACVFEVLRVYPLMSNFIEITHNPTNDSGYDGFESLGILIGYLNRFSVTNETNIVKILGPKNTTKFGVGIFSYSESTLVEIKEILEFLSQACKKLGPPKVKIYNEEESIYSNVKMSLTDNLTLAKITKEIDSISILLRFGVLPQENKSVYMLAMPKTLIGDNVINYLTNKGVFIETFY